MKKIGKFFVIIMVPIMFLFSGCVPSESGASGVGNDYDENFWGVKYTYHNTNKYNSDVFCDTGLKITEVFSKILLVSLCGEYGLGFEKGSVDIATQNEVFKLDLKEKFPFGSETVKLPTEVEGEFLIYEPSVKTSRKDAINTPYDDGVQNKNEYVWKMNLSILETETANEYAIRYAEQNYKKVQLAIALVFAGVDLKTEEVQAYYDKTILDDEKITLELEKIFRRQGAKILTLNGKEVFVERLGVLKEDMHIIVDFVLKNVIGKKQVDFDNKQFEKNKNNLGNVDAFEGEEYIKIPNNKIEKYYAEGDIFEDANGNGKFDVLSGGDLELQVYDIRKDYFKNYKNVVERILNKMYEEISSNEDLKFITKLQSNIRTDFSYLSAFENEKKNTANFNSFIIMSKEKMDVYFEMVISSEADIKVLLKRHLKSGVKVEEISTNKTQNGKILVEFEEKMQGWKKKDDAVGEMIYGTDVYSKYNHQISNNNVSVEYNKTNEEFLEFCFVNSSSLPFTINFEVFIY